MSPIDLSRRRLAEADAAELEELQAQQAELAGRLKSAHEQLKTARAALRDALMCDPALKVGDALLDLNAITLASKCDHFAIDEHDDGQHVIHFTRGPITCAVFFETAAQALEGAHAARERIA